MPKTTDYLEKVSPFNIDSRVCFETQEDFVFHRDIVSKKSEPVFVEEKGSLLENWLEVKRILTGGS
jgi:hypothetical protein